MQDRVEKCQVCHNVIGIGESIVAFGGIYILSSNNKIDNTESIIAGLVHIKCLNIDHNSIVVNNTKEVEEVEHTDQDLKSKLIQVINGLGHKISDQDADQIIINCRENGDITIDYMVGQFFKEI